MIAADQRFLLLTAPAFELALCRDGVVKPIEELMKDQGHRPPCCRIAAIDAGLMLGEAALKIAARNADVVRAVVTEEDVDPNIHCSCSVRPSRPRCARRLRMREIRD